MVTDNGDTEETGRSNPRKATIAIRVLPADKRAWEEAAAREDLPLSIWVRRVLNREAKYDQRHDGGHERS